MFLRLSAEVFFYFNFYYLFQGGKEYEKVCLC
nr:MAG TPA: hypothetical protein [Caudoviricetes sp.]